MAIAAGGDEERDEDGQVVAGVDEGRAGDRTGADADRGQGERYEEEHEDRGPGMGELLGVEEREEDAGDDAGANNGGAAAEGQIVGVGGETRGLGFGEEVEVLG